MRVWPVNFGVSRCSLNAGMSRKGIVDVTKSRCLPKVEWRAAYLLRLKWKPRIKYLKQQMDDKIYELLLTWVLSTSQFGRQLLECGLRMELIARERKDVILRLWESATSHAFLIAIPKPWLGSLGLSNMRFALLVLSPLLGQPPRFGCNSGSEVAQ